MNKIKRGDIVTRNSNNNDTLFYVKDIIKSKDIPTIVILKGITLRIEICEYLKNINRVSKNIANEKIEKFEKNINKKTNEIMYQDFNNRKDLNNIRKGLILHIDGDKKYAERSAKIYEKLKLKAIVKNIKESRQPYEIKNLLNKYHPDIVVITGHDGMIKKRCRYNDLYNYRNSKYFVSVVDEIRKWEQGENNIAIFAGACQSYYEAIMEAGANFASSPARILIDFMDPLIIAQTIATTINSSYITIKDISRKVKGWNKWNKWNWKLWKNENNK